MLPTLYVNIFINILMKSDICSAVVTDEEEILIVAFTLAISSRKSRRKRKTWSKTGSGNVEDYLVRMLCSKNYKQMMILKIILNKY